MVTAGASANAAAAALFDGGEDLLDLAIGMTISSSVCRARGFFSVPRRIKSPRPRRGLYQQPEATLGASLLHRFFRGFDRARPDNFSGRFGLEGHRLTRKGIGALARLGRRLLNDNEFCEAGNNERAVLFQLLVANLG